VSAPTVKFCGLTRPEDAAEAARLGAAYVGAIFAGGPRLVSAGQAATVFAAARAAAAASGIAAPRAVGVMGAQRSLEITRLVDEATLDVVQLHGDPTPHDIAEVRERTGAQIWAVLRVQGSVLPEEATGLFLYADAVVLDAKVPGRLGGTGVALDWDALAESLASLRGTTPIVLAGGLTPLNVAQAARTMLPNVVDVSSGVEQTPGVKDPQLMRAFVAQIP
jgi:phosphoribosylanthranilate isomerase